MIHSPISRRALAIGGALCALAFGAAACGSSDNNSSTSGGGSSTSAKSGSFKVGVLLPDTQSSVRWESFDRPLLQQAFKAAGVDATIDNAQGDKSTQQQQAEQLITNGAKVLLLVNLDSGSGAAIEANAQSRGVKVIDYDRLTLKGSAAYYVSFDNVQVGKLQGQGLVDCLNKSGASTPAIAELKGQQPPAGLVNGKTNDTAKDVPSVLLTPQAITKDNVKVVFDDGFLKPSDVCVGKYASMCTQAGISG